MRVQHPRWPFPSSLFPRLVDVNTTARYLSVTLTLGLPHSAVCLGWFLCNRAFSSVFCILTLRSALHRGEVGGDGFRLLIRGIRGDLWFTTLFVYCYQDHKHRPHMHSRMHPRVASSTGPGFWIEELDAWGRWPTSLSRNTIFEPFPSLPPGAAVRSAQISFAIPLNEAYLQIQFPGPGLR
jgi:hypothetical protein